MVISGLKHTLTKYWREPLAPTDTHALDSAESITLHRELIQSKPLLRAVYRQWYADYGRALKATEFLSALPVIELGSGAGLVKEFYPEVIRTDVLPSAHVDAVVFADRLPYQPKSLRCILMTDVLHHLPKPAAFFSEAVRCLAAGGRVLMIEPFNSPLSRLWGKFHPQEIFDPAVESWDSEITGRLSKANMAIPWVVLVRDRKRFESLFPDLKIVSITPHTSFAYLLTGGLTFRPFIPYGLGRLLLYAERYLVRIAPCLATMMTVEIEKRAAPQL